MEQVPCLIEIGQPETQKKLLYKKKNPEQKYKQQKLYSTFAKATA